jgi:catechol 2,3-dioxygenase-like lactoylglutathione lyase family enzyme
LGAVLKRTTLIVRDAEAAAEWYAHVFEMKRWLDTPFELSGVGLAIGKAGDKTHLIVMQCEDPVIGMIGLLEWVEPKQDFPAVPDRVQVGMPVFVMATDDAHGVYQRAAATNARIYAQPYEWSFDAPDGTRKDMIGCSFFDRDGYFFEVNQTV